MFKNSLYIIALFLTTACSSISKVETEPVAIHSIVNDPETVLVDVRIPEQYKAGTAQNAINIPLADLENNLDFLSKQKKVVVFCNKGKQADQAMELLKKKGFTNVYDGTTWKNVRAIIQEKEVKKND